MSFYEAPSLITFAIANMIRKFDLVLRSLPPGAPRDGGSGVWGRSPMKKARNVGPNKYLIIAMYAARKGVTGLAPAGLVPRRWPHTALAHAPAEGAPLGVWTARFINLIELVWISLMKPGSPPARGRRSKKNVGLDPGSSPGRRLRKSGFFYCVVPASEPGSSQKPLSLNWLRAGFHQPSFKVLRS